MRSAFIAAAFAAGVLAVPNKRDLATTVQLDIVTAFVTVTAGTPAATSAALFNANNRVLASAPASAAAAATSAAVVVVDQTQDASGDVQGEVEQTTDDTQQAVDDSQSQGSSSDDSQSQDQSSSSAPQTGDQSGNPGPTPGVNLDFKDGPTGDYQQTVVDHHNFHRRNHSSPDLGWDGKLASTAQKIAETCVYGHNTDMDGGGYGQNIAAGISPDNIAVVITDMFYNNEVNYYNGLYTLADPSDNNFEAWGHFSQIVWAATSAVGCATVDCSGSGVGWFTVCNYASPGNWAGAYGSNIGEPLGGRTIYG